jgi:hypothetical protein
VLTFREFIFKAHAHDNPRGDLIKDLRADSQLPDIAIGPELQGYLVRRGTCFEAQLAAKHLWREYVRTAFKAQSS